MVWVIILIGIIGVIFSMFYLDLNKDNQDLQDNTVDEKFSVIVQAINDTAFNGKASVTRLNKRSFNLYEEGQNQIVKFMYATGNLYITWRYKYFQKEVVHERQFNDVRNLSIFEQENIAEQMIKEMNEKVLNHKKRVDKDIFNNPY
jgi:hypothetical protein